MYGFPLSPVAVSRWCLPLSPVVSRGGAARKPPSGGAQGSEIFFAHIAPMGPPTPIVGVKSTFYPLNRYPLRHLTSKFNPKTTLLRHSMSFAIYGGAINGHEISPISSCIYRASGPSTGPPAPQSMLEWVGKGSLSPLRGPTLN